MAPIATDSYAWRCLKVGSFGKRAVTSMKIHSAILLACATAGMTAAVAEEIPADTETDGTTSLPEILDASGAVIHTVLIRPHNIFDLEQPGENSFMYRLANKLHITTRPEVIRQQVLFSSGDNFSSQRLEETERLLRANGYIQDANVTPLLNEDGTVDVEVATSDTWTMAPTLSFSRAGGTNNSEIGIKDKNLLGRGIAVEAFYSSDVDRDSTVLKVVDKNLGNSWYRLKLDLEDSSDGYTRGIRLEKPFYALASPDAHGISYYDNDRIDSYYDLGKVVGEYRHESRNYEVFRGWSAGLKDGWVTRYSAGLGFDEHRFASTDNAQYDVNVIPGDRRLFYPFLSVERLENDFEETHNLNQISRTEDHYLGTRFSARLGFASRSLGSDRDAWLVDATAESGFGDLDRKSVFVSASLKSRIESGALQDFGLQGEARYYSRRSDKRLFFASGSGFYGRNLDPDHQLLLGGDTGLRGYPLRYQAGDRNVLFTIEQRYFTDWYPFRLFRVGGAVFFDAGRMWGQGGLETEKLGWLRDIGVGLRLGSTRSGLGNMVHIDLAHPLDGKPGIDNIQLLVSAKRSF